MLLEMTESDLDLLARYAQQGSEDAFSTLVGRHMNMVYSAALRQVRSPHLAEEVAQSVFTDLACSALKMKPDTVLGAWLYRATRCAACVVVRRESRRQRREQVAYEIAETNGVPASWTTIAPLLDEAMESLDGTDRDAVFLRYFENLSLREVGQTLHTSEDAAQKRVSRAVDRLRKFFSRRGIAIGSASLVAILSANAVQSAPLGLPTAISAAALFAGSAAPGAAVGAAAHILPAAATPKALSTTALLIQKAWLPLAIVAVLGIGLYLASRPPNPADSPVPRAESPVVAPTPGPVSPSPGMPVGLGAPLAVTNQSP